MDARKVAVIGRRSCFVVAVISCLLAGNQIMAGIIFVLLTAFEWQGSWLERLFKKKEKMKD